MNISIRNILTVQVIAMAVATAILGVTSILALKNSERDVRLITENAIPSIDLASNMNTQVSDIRLAEAAVLIATTPESRSEWLKTLEEREKVLGEQRAAYEPLISSEEERFLYDKFTARWEVYSEASAKMLDEIARGDFATAAETYQKESRPHFLAASEDLGKLEKWNVDAGLAAGAAAVSEGNQAVQIAIVIMVVTGLAAVGSFLIVQFMVVGPVRRITTAMQAVAGGEMEHPIPFATVRNEVGDMARTLAVFRDGLIETQRMREQQEIDRETAAAQLIEERNRIADAFEQRMGTLSNGFASASSELGESAQTLAAAAEETARQAGAVESASQDASANVQTVAAGAEELSASIQEIAARVTEAAAVAANAATDTERSNRQIQELARSAEQISAVVDLIADIAAQTNLLALNATIEAARAGQAGAGFAVVASEVKELAAQTARATEEIRSKISEVQSNTAGSVAAMERVNAAVAATRENAAIIAGAVEQQRGAASEISSSTQRAAAGAETVTSSISGVNAAAEATGAASTQLLGLSRDLQDRSVTLKNEVTAFVAQLRAS